MQCDLSAAKALGGEGSPIPWEVVLDLILCPHGSLDQGCIELVPVGSCSAAPQCICSCRWNFFVSSPQIAPGLTKGEVEHKQNAQNTKYASYELPDFKCWTGKNITRSSALLSETLFVC